MSLLQQLNEMSSEKGSVAKAIRAAMKKHGIVGQRLISRNHESGDMARGSYSDKRKEGRAVKVYVDEHMSPAQKDRVTYEIQKSFPDATVTFGPGKRQHSYSDPSPWIRVNVKEGMNEARDDNSSDGDITIKTRDGKKISLYDSDGTNYSTIGVSVT